MNKLFRSAVVAFSTIALSAMVLAPVAEAKAKKPVVKKKTHYYHLTVSAIPGADEHDFTNPTSRCLTAGMKTLNAQAVRQMNADIAKFGTGHPTAVADYREKIAIVWSAMEQPYCGYGAYGMTAVRHSFEKSVERIRQAFLDATKG